MTDSQEIRCRMAACRDDVDSWGFYLLNDNHFSLAEIVLDEVRYEWGDCGNGEPTDVHIAGLTPGAHARIWLDDGSGVELRMEFCLRIRCGDGTLHMRFEFPKLYRKNNLPLVNGLDRPGWEVFGELRDH
jgi:hypothetical protein